MTEQEAKNAVGEMLAVLATDKNLCAACRKAFSATADRLTAPAEDSSPEARFEGVKYVTWAKDVWELVRFERGLPTRLRVPGGNPITVDPLGMEPWHPKKGDRVWLEGGNRVGAVIDFTFDLDPPYVIRWDEGAEHAYRLSDLRPYQFGPEHTKPEPEREGGKAEFGEGELVAYSGGGLRVACGDGQFRWLHGVHASVYDGDWPMRRASEDDIKAYAAKYPHLVAVVLRAHAKTIAREAQKGAGR